MTHLQRLYETADGLGLQICYFPMENNTAISTPDGFIGMDVERLENSAGELVCLAHEMGHCLTGSFYNRYTPYDLRQRHENRADKWAILQLVAEDALDEAVAEGCCEIWNLAERFGVTEQFMQKAVCWYVHGNTAAELYF